MPIDKVLVERKTALILEDILHLEPISKHTLTEFIEKYEYEVLSERYLERIIGRMIDINFHIITELGHTPPRDYYGSFLQMGKLSVLPIALSEKLAHSAGLRNRIAHEYDEIDEKQIYSAIKSCLKDVPEYLACVRKFIAKNHLCPSPKNGKKR